jgi:hypothetical protein
VNVDLASEARDLGPPSLCRSEQELEELEKAAKAAKQKSKGG